MYWVNLDPTVGSEISKTRPVLIVSNNINNQYAATVSIVPITSSTNKIYPFEVLISSKESSLKVDSKIKANQIRTIDKSRITKKIGILSPDRMKEVDIAIKIHLALDY